MLGMMLKHSAAVALKQADIYCQNPTAHQKSKLTKLCKRVLTDAKDYANIEPQLEFGKVPAVFATSINEAIGDAPCPKIINDLLN
ncbi:MAG: hypothetical protein JRC86_01965 [Deltaproteobacteria bacterium]|nr:hypothetical protein [Deltaproteobacteria bacterium]